MDRFNHTLATQLVILVSEHEKDWEKHLPLVPRSSQMAVQESMHGKPALLMFGAPPEPEIAGPPEPDYI